MNISKQELVNIICAILMVLSFVFAAGMFATQAADKSNNEQQTCQHLGVSNG